jgi:tetratricopeptide (TPR) repeat protein
MALQLDLLVNEMAINLNNSPEVSPAWTKEVEGKASGYLQIADNYQAQGRFSDAEELYRMALSVCETAVGEGHQALCKPLMALGQFLVQRAKLIEAEPFLLQLKAIRMKAFTQAAQFYAQHKESFVGNPLLKDSYLLLVEAVEALSQVYERFNDCQKAEKVFLTLLRSSEEALGSKHELTLDALRRLAASYQRFGFYAHARVAYEELLDIGVEIFGERALELTPCLNALCQIYGKLELPFEQIRVLQLQAQVVESSQSEDCLELAASLTRLADVLVATYCNQELFAAAGEIEQAKIAYQRAVSIYEKHYGLKASTVESLKLRLKKLECRLNC